MKQIILIAITAFLSIAGFSQSEVAIYAKQNSAIHKKTAEVLQVNIYPNPCKNSKVNVEFKSHLISEIQLINIAGKTVLKKTYISSGMKRELRLDNIQNGIYLFKITSTDNKVVVKKFIVSK